VLEHEKLTMTMSHTALRLVGAELPFLAGLAQTVDLRLDYRVMTAAVTRSGLILVNPDWVPDLALDDLLFVMAHELMHLALKHHDRSSPDVDPWTLNCIEEYIINDMLAHDLDRRPPEFALWFEGARKMSSESVLLELRRRGVETRRPCWSVEPVVWLESDGPVPQTEHPDPTIFPGFPDTALARELSKAGLLEEAEPEETLESSQLPFDLVPIELEAEWFPESESARKQRSAMVRLSAERVLPLASLLSAVGMGRTGSRKGSVFAGSSPSDFEAMVEACQTKYRPPWEQALQSWMEQMGPGTRSWSRPSRRGSPGGVVLPGRSRIGWTLNIILDSSGSMWTLLTYLLGCLSQFCEAANVESVRIVQCDTRVTVDERVDPYQLASYRVSGFGGTDLTAAFERLEEDPEVVCALVITDGGLWRIPREPSYDVLWAVLGGFSWTRKPDYGRIIEVDWPEEKLG